VPFEQGQSQQSQAAAIAGSGLAIIHSSDVERNAKESEYLWQSVQIDMDELMPIVEDRVI